MASIGEAFVTIRADTAGFEGDITKSVGNVARAVAGMALAKGTFDFFADGVKAAGELERVAAQTNAVIKSTGGVANVSAQEVRALGDAMEKKTGIDQVQIETGANMLLTFKNIHNQAGKNNDIFNQAVQISTDLSVAFGKDLQGSAILVGKALEDPIRGMSALRRVGIQFSEDQEKTIKKMVETGDVLGAQKLILQELETQVGGSAAAFGETLPGKMAIAKQAVEDMKISMAAGLLPAIEFGTSAVQFLSEKVMELPGPLAGAGAAVLGFGGAALLMAPSVNAAVQVIKTVGPSILTAGANVGSAAVNFAQGAVSAGALGSGVAAAAGAVLGVGALMVGAGLGVAYLAGAFDTSGVSAQTFGKNLAAMPLAEAVPAFTNLGAAIQKAGESTVMANGPLLDGSLTLGVFKEMANASYPAALALAQAVDAYGLAGKNGLPTHKEMNVVLAEARGKFAEAAGAADASKASLDSYAQTIMAAKGTIDTIKVATDEWNTIVAASAGPRLEATAGTINYQQAVDDLTKALLEDTTGMDLNEQSGRNVAAALVNVTDASLTTAKQQIALAIANDDLTSAQDIAAVAAQGLTTDILNSGASAGYSADQMVMYTADILNIPPSAVTEILENSADAETRIRGFISYFLGINGTRSTTYLDTVYTTIFRQIGSPFSGGGGGLSNVHWGGYAAGGIAGAARGEITRGPALRWIGERGPEAVVPLGGGQIDARNRDAVMKRAGLFNIEPMANGGVVTSSGYPFGGDTRRIESLLMQIIRNQQASSAARKPSQSIVGSRR